MAGYRGLESDDPIPRIGRGDETAGSGNLAARNVALVQALFPEIMTDGKVDFDILRQLLGDAVEEGEERYGLNWKGKRRARAFALTPSLGTLRPVPEDSVDWENTRNILVEGDNLEALKLLRRSYAGKVKLIYIDPPYNTGNDFVYPDDYRDSIGKYLTLTGQKGEDGEALTTNKEASGRFHTDWLTMIYPRLMLAKELLRDDGAIFVSIDDNELYNLKSLMDELFGAEQFVATLIWEKTRKNDARLISKGHDYIVVFTRSKDCLKQLGLKWREAKPGAAEIQTEYERLRQHHGEDYASMEAGLARFYASLPRDHPSRKLTRYKRVDRNGVWRDDNMSWPGGGGPDYDVIHPDTGLPCAVPEGGWRYSTPEKMRKMIAAGKVAFRADHREPPIRKTYLVAVSEEEEGLSEQEDVGIQVAGTYFYRSALQASAAMAGLFDGLTVFDSPKDHEVIARWIAYAAAGDKDAIVLDFFAGSGTTGHAIMDLNVRDSGRRRYMLVQLPERIDASNAGQKGAARFLDSIGKPLTIVELTKERLRRAGAKIRAEHPEATVDTGFRVYRLDSSNLKPWQPDADDLEASILDAVDNMLPGRGEEDLLVELLLKTGIDLSLPDERRMIAGQTVHALGGGILMACLGDIVAAGVEALGQGIADWVEQLAPAQTTLYFRDGGLGDDGNRAATKANLAAILRQRLGDRIAKIASI